MMVTSNFSMLAIVMSPSPSHRHHTCGQFFTRWTKKNLHNPLWRSPSSNLKIRKETKVGQHKLVSLANFTINRGHFGFCLLIVLFALVGIPQTFHYFGRQSFQVKLLIATFVWIDRKWYNVSRVHIGFTIQFISSFPQKRKRKSDYFLSVILIKENLPVKVISHILIIW